MSKRTALLAEVLDDRPSKKPRLLLETTRALPYFNNKSFADCALLLVQDEATPQPEAAPATLVDQLRGVRTETSALPVVMPATSTAPTTAVAETLHVSKLILVSNSRFFEKLFTNGMSETNSKEVKIVLQSPTRYFVDMIRFLYIGELQTPLAELMEVWRVADQFEVHRVLHTIPERIGAQDFTIEQAKAILEIPEIQTRQEFEPVLAKTSDIVIAHLPPLKNGIDPLIKSLPLAAMVRYLSTDHAPRIATTENDILTAAVTWLDANNDPPGARYALLKCVRFPYLTRSFLAGLVVPLINESATLDATQRAELTTLAAHAFNFQTTLSLSPDRALPSKWAQAVDPTYDPAYMRKRVTYSLHPIEVSTSAVTFDISPAKFAELQLDPLNFELPAEPNYWNGVGFRLRLATDPGGLLRLKCFVETICGRKADTLPTVFLPVNIRLEWPLRNRVTTDENFVYNAKGTISKSSMELFERLTLERMRAVTEQLDVRVVISIPGFDWFEQRAYYKPELKWT